jgi:hypothetical protein
MVARMFGCGFAPRAARRGSFNHAPWFTQAKGLAVHSAPRPLWAVLNVAHSVKFAVSARMAEGARRRRT